MDLIHSFLGTIPARSHSSWCGTISLSQNVRTTSRKSSWSGSKIWRLTVAPHGRPKHPSDTATVTVARSL
jgi:hypothetical protein